MSITVQQVLEEMRRIAPPELAESWDNVGLLVDAGRPVDAILTTLDITAPVVEEAVRLGCSLIVSHHPVIFDPIKRITADDLPALLLKGGVSAICMHTNLDAAPGGVNDTLAELLGMRDTVPFADGCGRIGTVDATTAKALAELCEDTLGPGVRYVEAGRPVLRLAEVSGAGGSYWKEALDLGADCLVTGEANHHAACDARRLGMGLVAAGHWATERPIAGVLAKRLKEAFPDIPVTVSRADTDPFTYL
ncbi:Nif3-like dinuclear metal center hexameric protein [uncultured Gemmiger sp.]|uniref:Nif3-like dinuclear metal center hexameric protein n=1 Tax=uncultured Gemmiger sp. TaxID=1623490 RepID=UPI0025F7DF8F|nr:Nif3-like dinuclear metal center hexameric protein [uncultured Gemmiger sp.]